MSITINLYPEMNKQIADLLLMCEDNGMMLYAGAYIKELERQLAECQRKDVPERNIDHVCKEEKKKERKHMMERKRGDKNAKSNIRTVDAER